MANADINVTRLHSGTFAWDEFELRKDIAQLDKHYIVPYSPTDPRTWPLVRCVKSEYNRDYRKSKIPPAHVAYNKALMERFSQYTPMKRFTDAERFHLYPFNFDSSGKLRDVEVIPRQEYEEWKERFAKPSVSQTNAIVTSPTLAEALPGAEEPSSSSKFYKECLQALKELDSDSAAKSASMEAELKLAQEELEDVKQKLSQAEEAQTEREAVQRTAHERATAAEQEAADAEKRLTKSQKGLTSLAEEHKKLNDEVIPLQEAKEGAESELTKAKRRLAKYEQDIASYVKNVDKLSNEIIPTLEKSKEGVESRLTVTQKDLLETQSELVVARAQAAKAKQELQDITNELKKRKRPGDAATPPTKRARNGEDGCMDACAGTKEQTK